MRILRFVALFVSMLTCIVSQALTEDTFSSDGWVFKVFPEDSSTVKLTGYEPSIISLCPKELHIPASVVHGGRRFHVREISSDALKNLYAAETIMINDGIERIKNYMTTNICLYTIH